MCLEPDLNLCQSCEPLYCETRKQRNYKGICLQYNKCSQKRIGENLKQKNKTQSTGSFLNTIFREEEMETNGSENNKHKKWNYVSTLLFILSFLG